MAQSGINKVILLGNLGQDPEVRYTAGGVPIANVSIATSNSWKDKNTGEKKFRTEIVAWEMQMLSSRGEMSQQNQDSGFDQSSQNSQEESVPWDDEDIPF